MAPAQKSVLITGCSDGGIGSALAQVFQERDFLVFATARDLAKCSSLQTLPNVELIQLDIENSQQIKAAVETVKTRVESLDILYNNAAKNHFMSFLDEDLGEGRRIFENNVWAPHAVAQAFAPLVMKAKGTFVFTSSISGYVNVPFMGLYGASKRALEVMVETLRLEMQPFGVNVLSVVTGAVSSNGQTYFEDWKLPEGSVYKPIEPLWKERVKGADGYRRMPTKDYAKKVVTEILNGATGRIWYGEAAGGTKFGLSWIPQGMMDKGMVKGTGMDIMAQHVQRG